jgi:protein TonB
LAVTKKLPGSALRYLRPPHLDFPLLSRRAGESGEVVLRIVVDVHGRLKDAWVQKSSGFARIDQAALQDIRSARFVPHMDAGKPVEVESLAMLAYDLDR